MRINGLMPLQVRAILTQRFFAERVAIKMSIPKTTVKTTTVKRSN